MTTPPRLLIDARISRTWLTGVGQYTKFLVSAIRRQDPDIAIGVLLMPAVANPFENDHGVAVHRCVAGPGSPGQHRAVGRIALNGGYDGVLATHPLSATIGTSVGRFAVVHDLEPLLFPQFFPRSVVLYLRVIFPFVARRQHAILVDSAQTKRDIVDRIRPKSLRIEVAHLGLDHIAPIRDENEARARRSHYSLSAPYVLYHGNKRSHKNVGGVVTSYSQLEPALRDRFPLVITGRDDPQEAEFDMRPIRHLIEKHGLTRQVRFTGEVASEDLAAVYGGARVLFFPSLYEGFGLPVGEAMRCGTPVICSHAGSLAEVAANAAFVVNPRDPGDGTRALRAVLSDDALARSLAENSLAQAAPFTWASTARTTLTLLGLGSG